MKGGLLCRRLRSQGEGEAAAAKPLPEELPLSCYTIYSAWSGRYTLQQWMELRPELIEMSQGSLELWLGKQTLGRNSHASH